MHWLDQQSGPICQPEIGDTPSLHPLETLKVEYIEYIDLDAQFITFATNFVVSQRSESIGIASIAKPSLSVMYPARFKPPLILSNDSQYTSAIFTSISDKEYLAAVSKDQIHLWNLAKNTSSVAYKLKESGRWHMCVIDEKTVACVTQQPGGDGFHKIYILNMDTKKFTICCTIRIKADRSITDICDVKTTDGKACLLLSFPMDYLRCVELVGGKMRWQQEFRESSFVPVSICTDGSTVFVADPANV